MMRIELASAIPVQILPTAPVLPANTLRFYIDFQRHGEALFDRSQLHLRDASGQGIKTPFLVLSQELWSANGRWLTVLMEPGRIKRGMGADPAHEPALVEGRRYSLELKVLDQIARHTFQVGPRVMTSLDEEAWRVEPPAAGSREALMIVFDRVMDSALCESEIAVLGPAGHPIDIWTNLRNDGRQAQVVSNLPWSTGPHRMLFSSRLEDVCGNRLGEALDHELVGSVRPRMGEIVFNVH